MKSIKLGQTIYYYDEIFNMIRKCEVEKMLFSNEGDGIVKSTISLRDVNSFRIIKIYETQIEKCFESLEEFKEIMRLKVNKEINKQYLEWNKFNDAISNFKGL